MKRKLDKISFDAVAIYKDGSYKTINEYISKWVNDLNGMIRLLEIYLCDYVQNIKIEYYSPDIFELNPDRIISFNYTDTYEKMYSNKRSVIRYNYIHGKASIEHTVETCNMVLGIDEYLDESRKTRKLSLFSLRNTIKESIKEQIVNMSTGLIRTNRLKNLRNMIMRCIFLATL